MKTWLFGDVWTSRDDCFKLGQCILAGLGRLEVQECKLGFITREHGQVRACVAGLALIGFRGKVREAELDLNHYITSEVTVTRRIAKVLDVSEEIIKRCIRWHLIEELTAFEIASRLMTT